MAWPDENQDTASVLVPADITDARLISVTGNGAAIPEDSTAAWASGTTYAIGARVYSASTHRVYESLRDSNTGKDPTDIRNRTAIGAIPAWWLDIGPTNKWAMFDGYISTQTVATPSLQVKVRPGPANALTLLNLDGDSLSIEWRDAPGGNIIYTTGGAIPLEGSMPGDYYDYFFSPFKPLTQYSVSNVDTYNDAEITVTLNKGSGTAKIGMFSIGDLRPLGLPLKNTAVSPKSYSIIDEDEYGNFKITKRPKSRPMSMTIAVPFDLTDVVVQTIEDVIDIPVAFIGSTDPNHAKLTTFGLVSGNMDYSTYPDRTLTVTVKGFT